MWVLLGNSSRPPRSNGELPPLLLRLTNLLGYLFLILVNVLSSVGALCGTNAEVSAKFPTPLTPAGWAFAIWGLIFALEGLGIVYQIMNNGYQEGGWKASIVMKIGYGWQVGWVFQDLWQFAFVRENVPGMWLAAFALLVALVAFQLTLHRLSGTTKELRARGYAGMPVLAYVFYKLPTAVNAAWISVAAALGILIVPVSYGVSREQLVAPAAVLAVAVTAGGLWRLLRHRDAAYGFTLIWALSAVASNSSGNVPKAVKIVGIVCLVILALGVVSALVRAHKEHSTAAAAAASGVGGSLLIDPYNNSYGLYSDQRTFLSDPSPPASFHQKSSGNFTFPELQAPDGGVSSVPRPSADGVMVAVVLGGADKSKPSLAPVEPPLGLGSSANSVLGVGHVKGVGSTRVSGRGIDDSSVRRTGSTAGVQQGPGDYESAVQQGGTVGPPGPNSGRRVRFQDEEVAVPAVGGGWQ
ncbi:hypothetical protein VaNZ11_004793 [Volvox africanus]|uniref:Uncharacterized protein n=1 Tax=Volvox africanus TaxID=51714 RepID=A0ABQ5RX94_9CHLO|nr:hypothetical protein VaNZ11_004793 [Volvox africanus]